MHVVYVCFKLYYVLVSDSCLGRASGKNVACGKKMKNGVEIVQNFSVWFGNSKTEVLLLPMSERAKMRGARS